MLNYKQIFRKFLLGGKKPTPAVCAVAPPAAAAAASACEKEKKVCGISKAMDKASKTEQPDCCKKHTEEPLKVRPSELPIYSCDDKSRDAQTKEDDRSSLEQMIGVARKELWEFYEQYKGIERRALDFMETGKAHSETTAKFLQEEATTVHRAGAIGVGGLAGIIMGLRGGWFKRFFYGTAGASAMAAICYPRESAEFGQESIKLAKYYFAVVYNFIYGVKPEGFSFLGSPVAPPVADKTSETKEESAQQLTRDQSNPADKDLYTTRS